MTHTHISKLTMVVHLGLWHIATVEAHLLHQHFVHSNSSKLIATYCYGLIQWFDNVVQDCTITLCGVWGIYPATMYKLLWRYTGNHGATVARRCSQVAPIINKAFEMIVMPWYWTLDRWYKHKDENIGFRVRKGEELRELKTKCIMTGILIDISWCYASPRHDNTLPMG